MGSPVSLRDDFDAAALRSLARRTRDASQGRRLLALAAIYDGGSRGDAARIGSVGLQTVRDWVLRFTAAGPAGLVDGKAPGADAEAQRGPAPGACPDCRERADPGGTRGCPLAADRSRPMGLGRVPGFGLEADPEPGTAGDGFPQAVRPAASSGAERTRPGGVQKNFPALVADIARRKEAGARIEIWFQDEARIGQKNKITRRGARRGTRPRAPHDQRTRSAYIFGAICPQEGKGAGLVLPFCNSDAMALHLQEISRTVAPRAHAVLVMDQAGWHTSAKLDVPANITILTLPPRAPELNPVENVWQFMRDNWLSNRVFNSHDDIVDHCCDAWNKLVDQPWKIMSIGHREWAHRS